MLQGQLFALDIDTLPRNASSSKHRCLF